jgi:hypothetical protein
MPYAKGSRVKGLPCFPAILMPAGENQSTSEENVVGL